MNIVGIDISGREVRIIALKKEGEVITNYTGKYKPIKLEDDENAENVILFRDTLFATLNSFTPDIIVINYRDSKATGKYAPSAISFKIEGLIQLYDKAKIFFTKPQTIAAYFKKNSIELIPSYSYQTDALKLAYHYIKTKFQ